MKIPVGNFGFATPAPVDRSPVTRATDRLGQIVAGVGAQIDEQQQTLARAKDVTAYQEHALAVDTLKANYAAKIDSGDVPYEGAKAAFEADAAKIPAPKPNARDPAAAEALTRGTQMSIKRAGLDIDQVAVGARNKDLQSQGVSQLDALGKRVSLPGADVASINAQADVVGPVLRAGGLSEAQVSRTLQNFKDSNWYNQATQVAMQSRESIPALKQLEHDLTAKDGFYAEKMDTEKRNAVLSQVIGHRIQLENRMQSLGDRQEARAQLAARQIEQQISSGVPATADMWTSWGDTIRGTTVEPEFKEFQANEREIQNTLRAPIGEQVRLVQQRKSDLDQNGGTLAQAANVARLDRAVNGNIKLLRETPLLFSEQRLGDTNTPVDLSAPGNADAQAANSAELQDRSARIRALSKQFGVPVPLRPLLPQEVKQVSQILEGGATTAVADYLNDLRDSAGSTDVFRGMMAQVAPDQPVKAAAGVLASLQRDLTTSSHWFKPDESVTSRDTASLMIEGDRLLNRSSAVKAEDGKPQNQIIFTEAAAKGVQDEFGKAVGDTFRGDPLGEEKALQNARAYYVGKAARTGAVSRDSQTADPKLVREAVKATLGNVVDFHGQGNVLAPWGMAEHDFEDRVTRALHTRGAELGLSPEDINNNAWAFGLDDGPEDGVYVVTNGGRWQRDKNNKPILLDIRPPDPRAARGVIDRGGK